MIIFLDPELESAPYLSMMRAGATLDGALLRPRTLHDYGGVEDLATLAAGLMWAVTRTHALVDGNKRASVCLADRLCAVNGHHLAGADDALYDMTVAAASGTIDEAGLTERMRGVLVAGAPDASFAERYPDVIVRLAA